MYKSCHFMRFSIIIWVRSLKLLSEFIRSFLSFLLISLTSEPLKIWFCQFACHSSLFFLLSAITLKIVVRSRAIERFQRAMSPALVHKAKSWTRIKTYNDKKGTLFHWAQGIKKFCKLFSKIVIIGPLLNT